MTITVSVPDVLARQAAAQGLSVEAYVERLAVQAAQTDDQPHWVRFGPGGRTLEEAGRDIRELRKDVTLGGLKIKDLINEGRKD